MPRKILIIDDEVRLRESMADFLSIMGNEVKLAEDGEEGIKVMEEFNPDIIICDLMMPKMDGLEFFSYLKKSSIEIPFILLTARSESTIRRQASSAGIKNFITKPFAFDNLIEKIESI